MAGLEPGIHVLLCRAKTFDPHGEERRSRVSNHEAGIGAAGILRDALLRNAPQDEAEGQRKWLPVNPCAATYRATTGGRFLRPQPRGEVAEWLKAPHSKCGVPARVSGVRIPPSPPEPHPSC